MSTGPRQVVLEYGLDNDQSEILSDAYRVGHQNFYENYHHAETLAAMIDRVEVFAVPASTDDHAAAPVHHH